MRVIWVSPALPHPQAAGGWAHEFELLNEMADRHEIHVVSADLDTPLDHRVLLDRGMGFTRVPWTPYRWPSQRWRIASMMPRAKPNLMLWLKRDRERRVAEVLTGLNTSFKPDLVHITLGELAPLIDVVPDRPTALLLFDSLTREIEGRLAIERLPRRRAQLTLERSRTRKYERHWYKKADGLACVSAEDGAWFEQLLGQPVEVIENPIGDAFFDPPAVPRTSHIVSFIGTLNHHPNEDAIEWLVHDIWPDVARQRPDAELRVIGRGDAEGKRTARITALVEGVGGRVFVDVEDIRPFYWEAAAVVANIRLGAGMRNKVIHAMACGAPVVATTAAVEGVPAAGVADAVIADDAAALAAGIVTVLNNPGAALERATRAAEAMRELHSVNIGNRLEDWWKRAVG